MGGLRGAARWGCDIGRKTREGVVLGAEGRRERRVEGACVDKLKKEKEKKDEEVLNLTKRGAGRRDCDAGGRTGQGRCWG